MIHLTALSNYPKIIKYQAETIFSPTISDPALIVLESRLKIKNFFSHENTRYRRVSSQS